MLYLVSINLIFIFFFFFFNDTATTEIYTLSLHDALPIYFPQRRTIEVPVGREDRGAEPLDQPLERGLPGLDDLARDLVAVEDRHTQGAEELRRGGLAAGDAPGKAHAVDARAHGCAVNSPR